MRIHLSWSLLTLVVFGLFICQSANAATLVGKVIEINDGDEITIFNLNRPVRIKLLAIDAPEKDQAFGAVAKQHLFDLVYDKVVFVEYSGIGHHSSLLGRVTLKDTDICAQMIRDGAAWFHPFNKNLLTKSQREIYALSEQAARNERRGLWQEEGAIAPWEFVKAEESKKKQAEASLPKAVLSNQPVRSDRPTPELTNLHLLRTGTAVAQPSAALEDMSWADGTVVRNWSKFQPTGENFSALVPQGGKQVARSLPFGDQSVNVNYYMVRDTGAAYQLIWMTGPSLGESDLTAINMAFEGFIDGLNKGLERTIDGSFQCENPLKRNISAAGYTGREFDLTECTVPGILRLYTRVVGDNRLIYGGVVFYKDQDEKVSRFLKSLTVFGPKSTGPKSASLKSKGSTN